MRTKVRVVKVIVCVESAKSLKTNSTTQSAEHPLFLYTLDAHTMALSRGSGRSKVNARSVLRNHRDSQGFLWTR